jgi:hypothetical protein
MIFLYESNIQARSAGVIPHALQTPPWIEGEFPQTRKKMPAVLVEQVVGIDSVAPERSAAEVVN